MSVSKLKIRSNIFMFLIIFFALITIAGQRLHAAMNNSTWELIGQMDAINVAPNPDPFVMAIDEKSGVPYVSYYISNPHGFFLKVDKYDSKSKKWLGVDQLLLPINGTFMPPSLVISPLDSALYVSYRKSGFSGITVMKYDAESKQWSDISNNLPDSPFSELKLDQSGNPYIIYQDYYRTAGLTVAGYDAQKKIWTKIGNDIQTNSYIDFATMVITKKDTLNVAFSNGHQLTVMNFNGKNWEKVGLPQTIGYPPFRLVVDNSDTLYLAYSASGYATVVKLEDSQWTPIGQPFSPTAGGISSIDLVLDNNNTPYLAFAAYGQGQGEAWVMTYDTGKKNWVPYSSPMGKTNLFLYTHLGVSSKILYFGFADNGDFKINIMSRDGASLN